MVNPHAYLFIDVRDRAGIVATWAVEFGNPLELEAEGWTRESLKLGDVVRCRDSRREAMPARLSRNPWCWSVRASDCHFTSGAKCRVGCRSHSTLAGWTDPPGPPPGKTGYWGVASANTLVEDTGRQIPMNQDGLLLNLADAGRVAPFQPWAKALMSIGNGRC